MFSKLTLALFLFSLSSFSAVITCGAVSCTGSLDSADEVLLRNFSLSSPALVTIQTWGAGGGTNHAGTAISAGGFDPLISVFGPGPDFLFAGDNDDGGCPPADAVAGSCLDARLELLLAPGTYSLALSAFPNFALGPDFRLEDGFIGFGDFDGRTADFAFDLTLTEVPEPSTFAFVLGTAVLFAGRMRQKLLQRGREGRQ